MVVEDEERLPVWHGLRWIPTWLAYLAMATFALRHAMLCYAVRLPCHGRSRRSMISPAPQRPSANRSGDVGGPRSRVTQHGTASTSYPAAAA